MSKRWHLNVANWLKGYRIQNITQTFELFEAAEENYWGVAAVEGFIFSISMISAGQANKT